MNFKDYYDVNEHKKTINESNNFLNNNRDISRWLESMKIKKWTINDDLTVDVKDNVDLRNKNLQFLPVQFGKVEGDFICSYNNLESLKGCPSVHKFIFDCSHNKLKTLEYAPNKILKNFYCDFNLLTDLEFCPTVKGFFSCKNNQLVTLKGCPKKMGQNFDCSDNKKLKNLDYAPNCDNLVSDLSKDLNESKKPTWEFQTILNYIKKHKIPVAEMTGKAKETCIETIAQMIGFRIKYISDNWDKIVELSKDLNENNLIGENKMNFTKQYTDLITESVLTKIDKKDTRKYIDIIAESCIEKDTDKLTESEQDSVIKQVLENVKEYLGEKTDKDEEDDKDEKKKADAPSKADEDKYLSGGQKNLPDGLKAGIIAKAKKEGKTADKDDDKDEKDDKDKKDKDLKESEDVLNFSKYIFGNVRSALGSNLEEAKKYSETNHEALHFINEETSEQFLIRSFNGKTTVNKIEEVGLNKLNVKFHINESEAYQILAQGKYHHRNVINPEVKSLIEFTQRSGRNVHWQYKDNCYKMNIKD